MFLLLALGCSGETKFSGTPIPTVTPSSLDFGEVVVNGNGKGITATVSNEGLGWFHVLSAELASGSSPDFSILDWPSDMEFRGGVEAPLSVVYTPSGEGQDYGTVLLTTDYQDLVIEVPIGGFGVIPVVDLDPSVLYFGTVPVGASVELPAAVGADGSGDLVITSVYIEPDDGSYTIEYRPPEAATWPYVVRNGAAITLDVTFAPQDDLEHNATVYLVTNDPENPTSAISLYGNSVYDPEETCPPTVEILSPDYGENYLDTDVVQLSGFVFDCDSNVSALFCSWFADGAYLTPGTISADGLVTGEATFPVGSPAIRLVCQDYELNPGEDSVTVTVYDDEEPLTYTISGGESLFDYFLIDDDISFYLNGAADPFHEDENGTSDTLAPFQFEASVGDEIRIVAMDQNATEAVVSELWLHWGAGQSQKLNDYVCYSSDPENECHDGTYLGPWPNVILDEAYTIAIP